MFDFRTIPYLPRALSHSGIMEAHFRSVAAIRFGTEADHLNGLLGLYDRKYDQKLASCSDLCAAPPGWIEDHRVLLPEEFRPSGQEQIGRRLNKMLHAPGDKEAIAAILAAASTVTEAKAAKRQKRVRYIRSIPDLAMRLARADDDCPELVNALLLGQLGYCADLIGADRLGRLDRDTAASLLLIMARTWGLHDLQIIAAKLHQAMYAPTAGLLEGPNAGLQTFQAVMRDPFKMGKMAAIATSLLKNPEGSNAGDLRRKLSGFAAATGLQASALSLGTSLGFTSDELANGLEAPMTHASRGVELFSFFAEAGASIGNAIEVDRTLAFDAGIQMRKKREKRRPVSHMTAAATRYGLEGPAALSYAIIAFIDLADHLPLMLERRIRGEAVYDEPRLPDAELKKAHHRVTFEKMFLTYRVIFLRDDNCLREEVKELMPSESDLGPFASARAVTEARRDFIMGRSANVSERLGEENPLTSEGVEPGRRTGYGANSLRVALSVRTKEQKAGYQTYNHELTPAFSWRLSK